jgi:hypothetical protein
MQETLQRVAELACTVVSAATRVGLTLMCDGRPSATVFVEAPPQGVDEAEQGGDAGPCVRSQVSDASVEHRSYSTLSLPLTVAGETIGTLDLYAPAENAFSPAEVQAATEFGAHAADLLAIARAYRTSLENAQQLELALLSRALIDQAKGIVMATVRCTADEAFALLTEQSQRQNRNLRDVAQEIVTQVSHRH